MRLNLGSGEKQVSGHLGVDFRAGPNTDILADVARLPFKSGSIEGLWASDIIEHFPWARTTEVLNEWNRVLAPGGELMVKLPNMRTIAERYLKGEIHCFEAQRLLYGGQDYFGNFHMAGFDPERFKGLANHCGFRVVRIRERPDPPDQNNMIVKLVKVR